MLPVACVTVCLNNAAHRWLRAHREAVWTFFRAATALSRSPAVTLHHRLRQKLPLRSRNVHLNEFVPKETTNQQFSHLKDMAAVQYRGVAGF